MGCDIHIILEKRYNDKWVGLRELSGQTVFTTKDGKLSPEWRFNPGRERNYDRFGRLAGVRRDGPPAKGLPEDASDLSRMLFQEWDGDGHSHSWNMLEEALEIYLATEYEAAKAHLLVGDPRHDQPLNYYFGIEDDGCDKSQYRIVYCFDN